MRPTISQMKFLDSAEAAQIKSTLERMQADPQFCTEDYNNTPFVEMHMTYLSDHPKLNPQHYLSNLRLKTRKAR
jgi:hypothetical protein